MWLRTTKLQEAIAYTTLVKSLFDQLPRSFINELYLPRTLSTTLETLFTSQTIFPDDTTVYESHINLYTSSSKTGKPPSSSISSSPPSLPVRAWPAVQILSEDTPTNIYALLLWSFCEDAIDWSLRRVSQPPRPFELPLLLQEGHFPNLPKVRTCRPRAPRWIGCKLATVERQNFTGRIESNTMRIGLKLLADRSFCT